jgi:enamine deaminase RidA (YjgF/YER057c/UK114 family)
MQIEPIRPAGWRKPRGYENGIAAAGAGKILWIAGQIAWDAEQRLVGRGDFPRQFRQALENVLAVVRAAGGEPRHVVQLTVYVVDKREYLASTRALGQTWRELLGEHYPAMALVQVADLLEDGALVEIQGVAALPSATGGASSARSGDGRFA